MLENLFEHFNEKIMRTTKMVSKMYFWQQFTEKLIIKDDVKQAKIQLCSTQDLLLARVSKH
mgnify:CR=1 FL=1